VSGINDGIAVDYRYESTNFAFLSFHRFLKRDNDTNAWEDLGDDLGREKASQVLRDAVATHTDERGDNNSEQEHGHASPGPPYMDLREDRTQNVAYVSTPGLQSTTPSSFPPPTPISISRKRRRYFAEQPSSSFHSYDYITPPTIGHPPHLSERYEHADHHMSHSHFSQQYPPRIAPQRQRPPRRASAAAPPDAARSGEFQANLNEFDLFNGELLESDHDEPEGPLQPESHRDTF
jgi:hypothetical protein